MVSVGSSKKIFDRRKKYFSKKKKKNESTCDDVIHCWVQNSKCCEEGLLKGC